MCTEIKGNQTELDELSAIVNDIIVYEKFHPAKDHESKILKAEKLDKMIVDGDKAFQDAGTSTKEEAMYWYLWGKMYNCSPNYLQKGIDVLKRATAIDPDFVDAWNELGECYWSIMEVHLAKECFESALQKSVNKVSLRNLSVVMRNQCLKMKQNDKTEALNNALSQAKRALDLDLTDGQSWSTLGNAYLAVFFNSPLQRQHILQAIACYSQAERNLDNTDRTDVFFNKAVAYKHIENYSGALGYLSKCLGSDSAWDLPSRTYDSLIQYLEKIENIIGHKGKLQSKRYNTMLKGLDRQLKKYSTSTNYVMNNIRDLKVGANEGSILYGKVLWIIDAETSFPVTFGMVDARGDEIVASVFNLNSCLNFFKIGDNVAIPDPQYEIVDVMHKNKVYKFKKVRIDNPTTLLINNKFLPQQCFVKYIFETSPN